MRKIFPLIAVIAVIFVLGGCASYAQYSSLAKEHSFDYFFPSSSFHRTFDTIDEAYDFVMTAQSKFSSSAGKSLAKGIPGKLDGPELRLDKPAAVICFMEASNPGYIDLENAEDPLEKIIKESISANIVFLVFYEGRGISISSFYLASGWVYSSSRQHTSFNVMDKRYKADYPAMWSNDKAFKYVRGEIN